MSRLPKQPAFTLLELLITSLLGAMLLMGATAMFGLFMRNSSYTNIRKQINSEGQQVQAFMEYHLRNARDVISCPGGDSIQFTSQDGGTTVFQRVTTTPHYIGINPPDPPATVHRLHTQFPAATVSFVCDSTTNASSVTINFTLTYTSITPAISQTFTSTVQVRNVSIR